LSIIREIQPDDPLDDVEDDVCITCATVKADPDAADLLPMTSDWMGLVDAARAKDREARFANADATASRVVSNFYFDRACTRFGDDLYLAVDKNRESARWLQFFTMPVSRFIKIRFDKQIQKVKAWLDPKINDDIVDKHRTPLTTWSNAAAAALEQTASTSMVRAAARIAREQLAEDLTRERDGLYDALSERARERGLPRDWPRQFFRVSTRKTTDTSDDTTPPAPAPAPGG
jgi:hypothetical protein